MERAKSTTSKAVSQPSNSGTSGHTATWRHGTATSTVPRSAWRMPVMIDSIVVFALAVLGVAAVLAAVGGVVFARRDLT